MHFQAIRQLIRLHDACHSFAEKMYHHGLCARLDKTSTDTWTASLQRLLISRKKKQQLLTADFCSFCGLSNR